MALDLEEQEQVAELRAWWNQHGNLIVSAITAAALAFAGWQGWRWYERNQAAQAGALYDTIVRASRAGDAKALRDADGALLENYPRTLYASLGAMLAARFYYERKGAESAKAQADLGPGHGRTGRSSRSRRSCARSGARAPAAPIASSSSRRSPTARCTARRATAR